MADALARWGRLGGQCQTLGPDPWDLVHHIDPVTGDPIGLTPVLRRRGCSVVWRGPLTDPERALIAMNDLILDPQRGRRPLYLLGADDALRSAGEKLGARVLWVGSECYLDAQSWSLAGGRRQKIRWARNHAAPSCKWRLGDPVGSATDRDAMLAVEASWKAERRERATDSFLRTSLMEIADRRRFAVCEHDAEIVAYAVASPLNGQSWYLQDLVRRPDAMRGALEGAVAHLLDALRDEGAHEISNGILPFWSPRHADAAHQGNGLIATRAIQFFDRRYRFSGINQFRLKLEPDRVEPVYVLIWPKRLRVGSVLSLARALT